MQKVIMKTYTFPEIVPHWIQWWGPSITQEQVDNAGKEFARGYKKMKALQMIKANGGARYVDIIKVLYELSFGPGTYSSTHDRSRGYSVGLFSNPCQSTWPSLCCDHIGKLYVINERGEKELAELEQKFPNL